MLRTIFRSFILWVRRKYATHPGIVASAVLHVFLILFLIGGLPNLFKDKEKDIIAVSVALVPEEKEITKIRAMPPAVPKKIEKPKPSPVKKIVSKPKPPPPPKPKPKEVPKLKIEPKKEAPKPKVEPKKQPPKPVKKEQLNIMDNILKNLEKDIGEEITPPPSPAPKAIAVEDIDIGMTNREVSLIIKQISDNWSMIPTGTGSVHDISVDLRISLARDGAVRSVEIVDQARYNSPSESFYRAAADSAVRATHRASPFKKLPLRKYDTWKELYIVFHPQ